jgi:acyl carrier protein
MANNTAAIMSYKRYGFSKFSEITSNTDDILKLLPYNKKILLTKTIKIIMDENKLLEQVQIIFRKVFGDDKLEINMEMTANDVDNWDSLTHMILISEIEKELDIKFKLRELNKMKNIGGLIETITSKIS